MLNSLFGSIQVRSVTFFTKVSAETLWKAMTSCRSGGRKKGRLKAFKKPKDLNRGQSLGHGAINTIWPGLNSPVMNDNRLVTPRYLKPDPNRLERMIAHREERKLIVRKKTVHPMLRGFSGGRVAGTKQVLPENLKDYSAVCLMTRHAVCMEPRGRTRHNSVVVAMGNANGLLSFAFAKSQDQRSAMGIALRDVPNRMQYVHRLDDHTVFHDFYAACCGVRIFVERKPKGFGLRCHRVIKVLCELAGITDLRAKVEGNTRNYFNIVKAFVAGLMNQETHEQLAERKRLHVVEFRAENGYLPRIVASPRDGKLRTVNELETNEVLDVEEMYGENKFPMYKPTFVKPLYLTPKYASYRKKVFDEHPYRNMYKLKWRLMADEILRDGSVESRYEEAAKTHRRVLMGEKLMPMGFGLPDLFRKSLLEERDLKGAEKNES